MNRSLLKQFIASCLISETIEDDANFGIKIFKALLSLSQKFAADIDFFIVSCEKDADGKCTSFPGTMIGIPGMENVDFLLWYSVTDSRSEGSLLYFPAGTPYDAENIPNENRRYEFALGFMSEIDPDDSAEETNEKLSTELYRCLVQSQDFRQNFFHEVGHLKSLAKMTTGTTSKIWDYEKAPASAKPDRKREKLDAWIKHHGVEAYPRMMEIMGRLVFEYENQPALRFRRKFPTAQDFVVAFNTFSLPTNGEKRGSRDGIKYARKLAEIWEFIASGSLE